MSALIETNGLGSLCADQASLSPEIWVTSVKSALQQTLQAMKSCQAVEEAWKNVFAHKVQMEGWKGSVPKHMCGGAIFRTGSGSTVALSGPPAESQAAAVISFCLHCQLIVTKLAVQAYINV